MQEQPEWNHSSKDCKMKQPDITTKLAPLWMGGWARDLWQSFPTSVLLWFLWVLWPVLEKPGPYHLHLCAFVHRFMCFSENDEKSAQETWEQKKHMTMQNAVFRSGITMKKEKPDCHISSFFISVRRTLQILLKASQHTSGAKIHYLYFTDEKAKAQKPNCDH